MVTFGSIVETSIKTVDWEGEICKGILFSDGRIYIEFRDRTVFDSFSVHDEHIYIPQALTAKTSDILDILETGTEKYFHYTEETLPDHFKEEWIYQEHIKGGVFDAIIYDANEEVIFFFQRNCENIAEIREVIDFYNENFNKALFTKAARK